MTDEFIERRIVTGLVVSTDYIKKIRLHWNEELLESPELRRIAGWCLEYFDKYERAPCRDIGSIYMDHLKHDRIPKSEAADIQAILNRISEDDEEDDRRGRPFNAEYLYDETVKFFQQRDLVQLSEQMDILAEQRRVAEAERLRQSFQLLTFEEEQTGLVRGDQIERKAIRWLWPYRIPLGKVTVLAGDPDVGKSLVTIDIAARVTTGREWPASEGKAPTGRALMISAEDDPEDTIMPRFDAAAGHDGRVYILRGVPRRDDHGNQYVDMWSLENLQLLRKHLDEWPGIRLITIDPIGAFVPKKINSWNDTQMRSLLAPLAALAHEYEVAILVVMHFRKGDGSAKEKVSGSYATVQQARSGFVIAVDPDDPHRRVMAQMKHNLGRPADALTYYIMEDEKRRPVVNWQNQTTQMDVDDLVKKVDPQARKVLDEIVDWLKGYLADGPVPPEQIFKDGMKQGGWSKDQLKRGKDRAGVRSHKDGFKGGWVWELKGADELNMQSSLPSLPSLPSHNKPLPSYNGPKSYNNPKVAENPEAREAREGSEESQESEGSKKYIRGYPANQKDGPANSVVDRVEGKGPNKFRMKVLANSRGARKATGP